MNFEAFRSFWKAVVGTRVQKYGSRFMKQKLIIATTAVADRTAGQISLSVCTRPGRCHVEARPMPPSRPPARKSIWWVGENGASTWFSKP